MLAGLLSASVVLAAEAPVYAAVQPIWIELNQSYYLNTGSQIERVAVANPKIADVRILGASALNIVAFGAGSTSLTVWTKNGMRQDFNIVVSVSDTGTANLIERAINLPNVKVDKVGDKIILRGKVRNQQEKDLAAYIASLYLQGEVSEGSSSNKETPYVINSDFSGLDEEASNPNIINLLEMTNPDQINFEAMVIEINSNDAKKLGMTYASPTANDGNSSSMTVNADGTVSGTTTTSGGVTLGDVGFFYGGESYGRQREAGHHWFNRNWLYTHFSEINAHIYALIEKGKARVVSRPNITTMSGKTAGILVGGQIPYPMRSGSDGAVSVEYKNYGIELDLVKPKIDQEGNITAEMYASVSRLDWTNAVTVEGFNMPGLATRSAQTMVNIPDGMTMVIGGLLNSDDSKTIQKVPLLGDIPILGELFKYHNNTNQKTEIMIMITPHVVNETTPVRMSDKMKEYYYDIEREKRAEPEVDVNAPVPTVEEEQAEIEAQKKAEEQKKLENPKLTQKEGSFLGKYLDQDVLRGTSDMEKRNARK